MQALSDAFLVDFSVILRKVETAPNPLPAELNRVGVMIFGADNGDRYVASLPAIRLDQVESTGPYAGVRLDQATPELTAFTAALVDGLASVQPAAPWPDTPVTGTPPWPGYDFWSGVPVDLVEYRTGYMGYE